VDDRREYIPIVLPLPAFAEHFEAKASTVAAAKE